MAKLSLQFHARRDEIADLVRKSVGELELWLAFETLTPAHSIVLIAQGQLPGKLQIPESASRIVLSIYPMDMDATGPFGLIGSNPAALSILMGRESGSALGESVLQAMTDDPKSLREWKKLRKLMTASFSKGAQVVNSATGARDRAGNHYFSPGARDLLASGVRMAGLTDLLSYELD